jgi:alkylhydroperoxidase family enzyme
LSRLLAPPPAESFSGRERDAYDRVAERENRILQDLPVTTSQVILDFKKAYGISPYRSPQMWSPPLAEILSQLGRFVRAGQLRGSYPHDLRELVDVVLSQECDYYAVLDTHIPDAVAVGTRPQAIAAVLRRQEDQLTERERNTVDFTRQVVRGEVQDELFHRMEQQLGRRGLVEFTGFICFLLFTLRYMEALGCPQPSRAELDRIVDGYLAGNTPAPNPESRIV